MINIPYNDQLADDHARQVSVLLVSRINTVLDNNGFNKGRRKDIPVSLSTELRKYLECLLVEKMMIKFLTLKPVGIRIVIRNVLQNYPHFFDKNSDDYQVLKNVFISHGYDNKLFSKKTFIDNISIDTCPYCNRNYIFSLSKAKKIKPEIDHFFPQTIYPFLGLSYYNLIPSCQTCNGVGGKHFDDTFLNGLVSPYEIEPDDFLFSYKPALNKNNPLLFSTVDIFFIQEKKKNTNTFKLDDLYKKHDDHVLELIIKSKMKYSKKYIKYLMKFKGLELSKKEIDRMILGNFSLEGELHKRPLSKLYADIGKELGLI